MYHKLKKKLRIKNNKIDKKEELKNQKTFISKTWFTAAAISHFFNSQFFNQKK